MDLSTQYGFIELPDKEELREQVSMFDLAAHFNLQWNAAHDKVKCPFHSGGKERTPSMQVHNEYVYCFGGCRKTWDCYEFVKDMMGISFSDAWVWLAERVTTLPKSDYQEAHPRADYRGDVPLDLIHFYQSCLGEEQRAWLREKRLLSDETINATGIGWRPDWQAYAFPFWRGEPFQSKADIMQFRSTPSSPAFGGVKWHYTGLKGHNRPSFVNRHRAGLNSAILVYGTLDSYLGCQDGLPMLSINGISVMLRDMAALTALSWTLRNTQNIYIVPDNQPNEAEPAYTLARLLNNRLGVNRARVRHFPQGSPKDYSEWRYAGRDVWDFLLEVIMTNWDSPFIDDKAQREWVTGILVYMSRGDWDRAESYLACLEPVCSPIILNHALQLRAQFDPFDGLDHQQWAGFLEDLQTNGVNHTHADIQNIIRKWAEIAYTQAGGF